MNVDRPHISMSGLRQIGPTEVTLLVDGESGSLDLELEVGAGHELKAWILSFGPGAEVLSPPSLRAELEADLKAALALYTS